MVPQDSTPTCFTSGRGHLIVGDSEGGVHLLSRQLRCERVAVFSRGPVVDVRQMRQAGTLIVLGEEERGSPAFKVLDLDKRDKQGTPTLLR